MGSDFCKTCFADLAPRAICSRCGDHRSSSDEPGDVLLPGCVLGGKYKVGCLLGRGGFGATYLAWDTNLRVRIAIKEFLPRQLVARVSGGTLVRPYTGSRDAFDIGLEQFLSEARNLAQFRDHPGIISVLDFFPENGTGYMVMEYLAGSTLEQYIATEGRLDYKIALRLLAPVADALRACHAVGLIHRDISPDNIFLTSDGRVKLLDFGAARLAIGSRSTNLSVILKEGYAPFEQYQRNGRQGPWTDIYALSATLYRLLTAELPTTSPDRLAGTPLPTPVEKGVKIPAGLQRLLDKGMAIQAEQRYQSVDAFLSDLREVLGTGTPKASGLPSATAGKQPDGRRRKRVIVLLSGIGLLGGVAALAIIWLQPAPDQQITLTAKSVEPPKTIGLATNDAVEHVTGKPAAPTPQKPVLPIPIASMREHVRQAAQAEIVLGYKLKDERQAFTLLNTLPANTKNETIIQARQTQEYRYNSAASERNDYLNKYMAEVEWLADHDESAVDAAVKLEYETNNIPTIDKGDAEVKAQFRGAISLVSGHVRDQRQQHLTPEAVTSDANSLVMGGSK